jgi:hypothetical protein
MNIFSTNPYKIYIIWISLFVFLCLLIPILSHGHNGGEQLGFTLFGHILNYFIEGLFLIAIITSFLYKAWFKTHWYVGVAIIVLTGSVLASVIILNGGISSLF